MIRRLRFAGPPLALQILGLLLGCLIVAQLVTLFLTLVLPPAPQPQYGLDAIARVLSGGAVRRNVSRPLQQSVQSGPPLLLGPGWLTSEQSRHDLARLLHRRDADVRLYFFTPLPFAGTAAFPRHRDASPLLTRQAAARQTGFVPVDYKVAQLSTSMATGALAGRFPGSDIPGGVIAGTILQNTTAIPNVSAEPLQSLPAEILRAPAATTPSLPAALPSATVPAATVSEPVAPQMQSGAGRVSPGTPALDAVPHTVLGVSAFSAARPVAAPLSLPNVVPLIDLPMPAIAPPRLALPPAPVLAIQAPRHAALAHAPPEIRRIKPSRPAAVAAGRPLNLPAPPSLNTVPKPVVRAAPPPEMPRERPVPMTEPRRGLFGLAPAPFVEGDFVAALRLPGGQWRVVRPVPEPFPNSWQRRVILWFFIAFAIVAPLGWLFAQRLVRPIAGFADAAEQLGRDPTASILALEGPAEVGRAAHAFNRMQSRLRSFVDDRTAMIGAISHDLRTPLTRLRFRIEDAPDALREGMLAEVEEMEQMISSVLAFIRDASEPGSREMLDLRSLVEDVVEDAAFVGKPVLLEDSMPANVEVDPLGIRRLLGNLIENAVKYGDRARVRLFTSQQEAIAEIHDDGPGLPEEELERVFQPFYRAPAARASSKHGTGLGLAVCRSIARAHGGDVQLRRADHGLVAQLRLPLAYGSMGS